MNTFSSQQPLFITVQIYHELFFDTAQRQQTNHAYLLFGFGFMPTDFCFSVLTTFLQFQFFARDKSEKHKKKGHTHIQRVNESEEIV